MKWLVIILLLSVKSFAGEPDDFSALAEVSKSPAKARYANEGINKTVNLVLDQAIATASPNSDGTCNKRALMNFLTDYLDRNLPLISGALPYNVPMVGPLNSTDVPYKAAPPYTEIYYNRSVRVKLGNQSVVMGVDKIDHFFSHGNLYWEIVGMDPALPADKVEKALLLGIKQEESTWGLAKTKVKSYGDLVANYKGLFFWRDLFNGKPPFLTCKNGHFVRQKDFNLEDYFEETMDETINCSSFADEATYKAIVQTNQQRGLKCPVSSEACGRARQKMGPTVALRVLHPLCLGTGQNQVERPIKLSILEFMLDVQKVRGGGAMYMLDKFFPEVTKELNKAILKKEKGAK